MPHYFLLHDIMEFQEYLRPALAVSWRSRDFTLLRPLYERLQPRIRDFASRYHLDNDEPIVARAAAGMPFDRTLWHHIVGEVLWYSAIAIPEIQTAQATLVCLLEPDLAVQQAAGRQNSPPIVQAHQGSRDLVFGGGFYRPDHAGYNGAPDVERLTAYLDAVNTDLWRPEDLTCATTAQEDDPAEALADAREWFPELLALYRHAAEARQLVICETL
jgi:hypothetical protein